MPFPFFSKKQCCVCRKSSIANKKEMCDSCLRIIARNLCHIRDDEPLEGNPEQQKKTWDIYVFDYGSFKKLFMD